MNFIETLKNVGGVKPCDSCKGTGETIYKHINDDFNRIVCPLCHGTGQVLDLAPLLAKPELLYDAVESLLGRLFEKTNAEESQFTKPFCVGPQRAHSLVYEIARQLGGTAVAAEPKLDEWTDKDGSYKMSELKKGKLVKDVGYRLSLPLQQSATVLFVTDRVDEKEVQQIVNLITKPGQDIHLLPYVLALVTNCEATRGFKVVSLYQEKS